ncbi:hypothetical protein B0T19DRAFT_406568, partial [Cercophora scortea]
MLFALVLLNLQVARSTSKVRRLVPQLRPGLLPRHLARSSHYHARDWHTLTETSRAESSRIKFVRPVLFLFPLSSLAGSYGVRTDTRAVFQQLINRHRAQQLPPVGRMNEGMDWKLSRNVPVPSMEEGCRYLPKGTSGAWAPASTNASPFHYHCSAPSGRGTCSITQAPDLDPSLLCTARLRAVVQHMDRAGQTGQLPSYIGSRLGDGPWVVRCVISWEGVITWEASRPPSSH